MAGDVNLQQLHVGYVAQLTTVPYVPVMNSGPLNTAHSEMLRLLDIVVERESTIAALMAEAERWAAEANNRDDLICAWGAACDFIDAHVGDPDMTAEMVRTYAEFQKWRAHLKTPTVRLQRVVRLHPTHVD